MKMNELIIASNGPVKRKTKTSTELGIGLPSFDLRGLH